MVRGNILLINGNILHTETQTADKNPLEYYVLTLDNIRFSKKHMQNDDIEETAEVLCITALKERFTEIQDLFHKMFSEMQTTSAYGANLTLGYLMIFLSMLIRQANISVCSEKKETHPYSSIVGYAKNFIDCYYNITFKIQDIADQISVSYSLLYHKFVREIGISPIEYKMYKQIDEAKSMLKNSDFSISQISVQAGFNDLAYFIKIFHKKTGLTPKDFRKISKKSVDTSHSAH